MIDQPLRLSGVSLVEAVLARWLVAASGVEYVLDTVRLHAAPDRSRLTEPDTEPPRDASAPVEDTAPAEDTAPVPETTPVDETDPVGDSAADDDDRFAGLAGFRGLLEAGAEHLAAAISAEREQRRQAGVQA